MSDDIKISFGFDPDNASANAVKRLTDDVKDTVETLKKSIDRSQNTLKEFFSTSGITNTLQKEIDQISRSAENAYSSLKKMSDVDTGGIGGGKSNRFEGVGSAALEGVGGAVGGEVGDLVSSLGGLGSAAGLAGVAVAALGVAIGVASNEYNKAREVFDTTIAKQSEYFDLLETSSTESLEAERETLENRRAILEQEKALRESQLDQLREQTGAIGGLFEAISASPFETIGGEGAAAFDSAREAVDAVNAELADLEGSLGNVEKALNSTEVAARDAANAALDSASQAGDLARLQLESANASREANEARLQSIEIERAATEAELNALQASGSASAEVASRIEELNGKLNNLASQSGVLQTAINRTADSAKEAAVELNKASEVNEKTAKKSSSTSKKEFKKTSLSLASFAGLTKKKQDENTENLKKSLEDQQRLWEDQQRKQKDFETNLLNSLEDFYATRQELEFAGDFRGIQQQERDFQRSIAQQSRDSGVNIRQAINNISNSNTSNNSFNMSTSLDQNALIALLQQLLSAN